MYIIQRLILIIIGLTSGIVISGAMVAFITAIGVIPIITVRMHVDHYYKTYGTAISLGALIGSIFAIWPNSFVLLPIPIVVLIGFFLGVFVGCFAVALAEVLNVIPLAYKRIHLNKGISATVIAFAIGKTLGSLLYWLHPYFLKVISS